MLIVEGETERAFLPHLRIYLEKYLCGNMPTIRSAKGVRGRIPKGDQLKRMVENLLAGPNQMADYVIAITDVYTGSQPVEFRDAADAKDKMRHWVGQEDRFYPHAAQYEFEAWLIPYWPTLQKLAGHNRSAPGGKPETVNHGNPPSKCIKELFEIGKCGRSYSKTRDADKILRDNDLSAAIDQCAELKSIVNTILNICDVPSIL